MNDGSRFFRIFLQCVWRSVLIAGVAAVSLTGVVLVFGQPAYAAEPYPVLLDDVQQGSLLVKSQHHEGYRQVPQLDTRADITINGLVARTVLTQSFRNESADWIEGIYVFPLSEKAAVHRYRMQVGERIIEGVVKERQAARREYAAARRSGRKAALIEQERPNMFTNSIANIAPGETIKVTLEYQQVVAYDNQTFRLRFPMAITPRYIPGQPLTNIPEEHIRETLSVGMGWAVDTDQVPDASRITPPQLRSSTGQNVSIQIDLNAGLALAGIHSPYHKIQVQHGHAGKAKISLDKGAISPDRDFVLEWIPTPSAAPRAALFQQMGEEESYGLMMVMPPTRSQSAVPSIRREVIFVIDTSGSMGGESIRQARQGLALAVKRLRPTDRFNIIEFNSRYTTLFEKPQAASDRHVQQALRFTASLQASGGTQMYPALEQALSQRGQAGFVKQIVFLTDGAVGNESQLFGLIERGLGDARLFTVGIGSAPNSYFMTRAASFGRGSFTYIGSVHEVSEKMQQLFARLETPVMTHLQIKWPAVVSTDDVYPGRLPDLYAGEPLMVHFKSSQPLKGDIEITGKRMTQSWQSTVQTQTPAKQSGLGVLWARKKIAALMDDLHRGGHAADIRQKVVTLALKHHLVSRYTSMVAVDKTPARPVGNTLKKTAVPGQLPHGQLPHRMAQQQARVLAMPQTASNFLYHLIVGFLLLLWVAYRGWRSSRRVQTPRWMPV